jgi:hypothetical protein
VAKRKLPSHISGTIRQWRTKKRRELRTLLRVADRVLRGAAYTPSVDGKTYYQVFQELRKFAQAWSQKEWGK